MNQLNRIYRMKKTGAFFLLLIFFSMCFQLTSVKAQNIPENLFRMAEGFVRIAEPGVFADTVSVFGDVNAPGRYILPRQTRIHELLGYARGPMQQRGGGQADWSKVRLEVTVSKLDPATGRRSMETFKFKYDEEYPEEYTDMPLGNDYIVTVEVKKRPSFLDYARAVSTVVGATVATLLFIDRIAE